MIDIILCIISVVSITLVCLLDHTRYKKNKYDPRIFRFRNNNENSMKDFIAYFGMAIPVIFIQNNKVKLSFVIIQAAILSTHYTLLALKSYRIKKVAESIYQVIIFDVILLILIVVTLWKYY